MAAGIVERGGRVTIFCAAYAGAAASRSATASSRAPRLQAVGLPRGPAGAALRRPRPRRRRRRRAERPAVLLALGHPQTRDRPGAPRAPRAVARRLSRVNGQVGWWIERPLAPRLYRRSQYVAVSRATRDGAPSLGVRGPRVAVVHNGTDMVRQRAGNSAHPRICVVGRLVPHKQVEHAIDAARRAARGAPRPAAHGRGRRLVGGTTCTVTPPSARPASRSSSRARRRGAQTGDLRGVLGDGAAVAQGGLGPRGRGGRRARHADRRLPTARRDPRVHRRRPLGAAGERRRTDRRHLRSVLGEAGLRTACRRAPTR